MKEVTVQQVYLRSKFPQTIAVKLIFFACCALAVMWWRLGGTIEDSQAYFDTVRYLRGELPLSELRAPFPYRIGVPFLASIIPYDARGSFAALNWAFVTLAAVMVAQTAVHIGASTRASFFAGLLLLLSFATYWYAPYLLVDPGSVFARACFTYGVITRRTAIAEASGILGTVIREENIMLLAWLTLTRKIPFMRGVMLIAIAGIWLVAVRWWIIHGLPSYTWSPSFAQFIAALEDWRSIATILATCGLVVPLAIIGWKRAPVQVAQLKSLVLIMAAPVAYAALCVRVDGRAVWGLYPFLIPFALGSIQRNRA